jgi:NarL family two-component system response regulator LiaR
MMGEPDRIRVMAVDDHEIFRGGIRFLMLTFDDIELVAEAHTGEEALRLCEQMQPDVVLMDMMMSGMDGIEATKVIRERYPSVQVLVLTSFYDGALVKRAMQAGAIGYLLKGVPREKLGEAIRSAHARQPTLAAEAVEALVQAADASCAIGQDLTEREHEVLELLVEGLSNAEIAARLVVSIAAVKYHVSNILFKLGATNRTEAVVLALQHNLLPKP